MSTTAQFNVTFPALSDVQFNQYSRMEEREELETFTSQKLEPSNTEQFCFIITWLIHQLLQL